MAFLLSLQSLQEKMPSVIHIRWTFMPQSRGRYTHVTPHTTHIPHTTQHTPHSSHNTHTSHNTTHPSFLTQHTSLTQHNTPLIPHTTHIPHTRVWSTRIQEYSNYKKLSFCGALKMHTNGSHNTPLHLTPCMTRPQRNRPHTSHQCGVEKVCLRKS